MSPHRFAGSVRIAPLDRFQDSLMVELASLRASIHSEDPAPLLAQQAHDRIEQGENQRVADGFGQSQVKVKVSLNVGFWVVQAAVHGSDGFPHAAEQLFLNAGRCQGSDLRLEDLT